MLDEMFNGPSSMETQPDLAPVIVLEEGVAMIQDCRTVEWWPVEEPEKMAKCWSIWKMKTNLCIPTLSFLTKD